MACCRLTISLRRLGDAFAQTIERVIHNDATPGIVERRRPFEAGVVFNPGANAFHFDPVGSRDHELLLHDARYDSTDEGGRKTGAASLLQPWNQFSRRALGI